MSKPDWDFWLRIRAVKLWQACALSLDVDPNKLTRDQNGIGLSGVPQFDPRSFPSLSVSKEFKKRFQILLSYLGDRERLHLYSVPLYGGSQVDDSQIVLRDFARWAIDEMHWKDLPAELTGLGPKRPSGARNPITATRDVVVSLPQTAAPRAVASKRTRSNILNDAIEAARNAAKDANNYQQVWAHLVRVARSSQPPAPLLGYVEGEGVKYEDASQPAKFLNKQALKKRLQRNPR